MNDFSSGLNYLERIAVALESIAVALKPENRLNPNPRPHCSDDEAKVSIEGML